MNNQAIPPLTGKKKEIVEMVAEGKPAKQISHHFKVTERCIIYTLKRLRKRYGCVNTIQLVVFCVENNLIREKTQEGSSS